ncbi:MAG: hypothetical protein K6E50_08260 [Lachnospiraceae bacterium]|nr:hypothetical protein [Lachnospiraceae bacterium]
MKKKMIGVLLAVVFSAAVLTACDGKQQSSGRQTYSPTQAAENGNGSENNGGGDASPTPEASPAPADATVVVSDVEELLAAIGPGARIILEPGTYNLSEYLQEKWDEQGTAWNRNNGNSYVWMEEVFDGVELHIEGVDGLSLIGRSQNREETVILTDPRYANVISFHESENLLLSNLTMGHTMTGYCVGDVLNFQRCCDVRLVNMDLYGCGVYGISADGGGTGASGNFHVYDSTIRDCSGGPLDIANNDLGDWFFFRCELSGSESGGYFYKLENAKLRFYDCVFGDKETENFYFREDTETENCEWGGIMNLPDYSGYEE